MSTAPGNNEALVKRNPQPHTSKLGLGLRHYLNALDLPGTLLASWAGLLILASANSAGGSTYAFCQHGTNS